jgi:hypothetical protein
MNTGVAIASIESALLSAPHDNFPVSSHEKISAAAALSKQGSQVSQDDESWRPRPRLLAAALIGLAVAVTLWGLGYKLSLYHFGASSASPTPLAKLWIEPRNSAPLPVILAKIQSRPGPDLSSFVLSEPQRISFAGFEAYSRTRCTNIVRFLAPHRALRSPPVTILR